MNSEPLITRKRHYFYVLVFSIAVWLFVAMLIGGFVPVYVEYPCSCYEHSSYENRSFYYFGFFGILSGLVFSYPLHRIIRVAYSKSNDKEVPLSMITRPGGCCCVWIFVLPLSIGVYIAGNTFTHAYLRVHPNEKAMVIHAALIDDIPTLRRLLEKGADPNIKGYRGLSPLHHVVYRIGKEDIVKLLIEYGANVNLKNRDGRPPLFLASSWGNLKMASLLIKNGADPNTIDNLGCTPLDLTKGYRMRQLLRAHGGKTAAELKAESTSGEK